MAELRTFFDDPRWPVAFVLVIVMITIASLLAQRGRSKRGQRFGGSRAGRPWAPSGALAPSAAPLVGVQPTQPIPPIAPRPAVVVPQQRRPLPEAPEPAEPVGTVLLAVTPGGPVGSVRAAGLLGIAPGVHVRIRRADVDPAALVAALPDDVAIHLDDLTAAPTDPVRNEMFRRGVDTARPRLPFAVLLTGPAPGPPVVAVTTIAAAPLLARDPELAALLAEATARPDDLQLFDTALLAATRSRPIEDVLDLDGLRTDGRWLEAHRSELCARYGALLGTWAVAS